MEHPGFIEIFCEAFFVATYTRKYGVFLSHFRIFDTFLCILLGFGAIWRKICPVLGITDRNWEWPTPNFFLPRLRRQGQKISP